MKNQKLKYKQEYNKSRQMIMIDFEKKKRREITDNVCQEFLEKTKGHKNPRILKLYYQLKAQSGF